MKTDSSLIKLNVLQERVDNMIRENSDEHAEILKSINTLSDKFDRLPEIFVTNSRFAPVEKVVYGIVSLIVIAVIGAIIKLVVH